MVGVDVSESLTVGMMLELELVELVELVALKELVEIEEVLVEAPEVVPEVVPEVLVELLLVVLKVLEVLVPEFPVLVTEPEVVTVSGQ